MKNIVTIAKKTPRFSAFPTTMNKVFIKSQLFLNSAGLKMNSAYKQPARNFLLKKVVEN